MRLEIGSFQVRDARFSSKTRFADGTLTIDREEVRRLILSDTTFEDVGIEITRPGEAIRLIHVMDVAEPRRKLNDGSTFPGIVGPQKIVGQGATHRLAGMAVIASGEAVAGETTYWREAIVDMAGPGAMASPFGSTINLVLEFKPHGDYLDASHPDAVVNDNMRGSALAQRYNLRVRAAELKVAAFLASTTIDQVPESVQVYELTPPVESLPRVVYFLQGAGLFIYGEHSNAILPTLIHPNEILDGALISIRSNSHASHREATYLNLNHAVIKSLYAHHGRDLDFAGVIIYRAAADSVDAKERTAHYAVKLAQLLQAQGACSSYLGGGHPCVEFMLICQKCEQAGITTVLLMPETYGTPEDPGFVHTVPEAVAIVSTGRATERMDLPPVDRVLGGSAFFDLADAPAGPLRIPYRYLYGCSSDTGSGRLTARQY